jgi:hypothetical protein
MTIDLGRIFTLEETPCAFYLFEVFLPELMETEAYKNGWVVVNKDIRYKKHRRKVRGLGTVEYEIPAAYIIELQFGGDSVTFTCFYGEMGLYVRMKTRLTTDSSLFLGSPKEQQKFTYELIQLIMMSYIAHKTRGRLYSEGIGVHE